MRVTPSITMAKQAANILRKRLRKEYSDGGRLPSEGELANELGVSRGTIRQSLAILQREGIIYRKQGSGTFANAHALRINTRIEHAMEFGQLIRNAGFRSDIKAIGIKKDFASDDLSKRLEIESNSPIFVVEKIFLANGQPAIFLTERVPISLIREEFNEDELYGPIFEFLEQRCHTQVNYTLAAVSPRAPSKRAAKLLKVEPNHALLEMDEVFSPRATSP